MIAQIFALGLTCSVCSATSTPIKLDRAKYNFAGSERYTNHVNKRAEALGVEEGFVLVEKARFVVQSKHICGNCAELFAKKISASTSSKSKSSKKLTG